MSSRTDLEYRLFGKLLEQSKKNTFLLIDCINGELPIALFTSYDKATAGSIATALEFTLRAMEDDGEDVQKLDESELLTSIKENLIDYYRIESVHTLDPTKPIFVIQTGNYRCPGKAVDYVTNDFSLWKEYGLKFFEDKINDQSWIERCTLVVDPVPEFVQ